MTTKTEALQKIRHQIRLAEGYQEDSPDWKGIVEVLAILREREHCLANEIQIDNFKASLRDEICKA